MNPEVQPTHPAADIGQCMRELADLFPGFAESSDAQVREWKIEFGGRPAGVCLEALRLYHRTESSIYPKLAAFLSNVRQVVDRNTPIDHTPIGRTQSYLRELRQTAEAVAKDTGLLDWVGSLPDPRRDELHRAAAQRMSAGNGLAEGRWLRRNPLESKALAAAMMAIEKEEAGKNMAGAA